MVCFGIRSNSPSGQQPNFPTVFFYESFLIQHRRTEKALTNFLAPFPAPWFLVFLVVLSRVSRPLVFYVTQSFLV